MDELLPDLRIHSFDVRVSRQQSSLRATRRAIEWQKSGKSSEAIGSNDTALWQEDSATEEARRRVIELGFPNPSEKQFLGKLVMIFGKYRHCTFKWLLENDVGYIKL